MHRATFVSLLAVAASACTVAPCPPPAAYPGQAAATSPVGACTEYRSTQCYWMENQSGNSCWVPAGELAPDYDSCFQADSCNGGGGRSNGGCYMWSDGSSLPRAPWPQTAPPVLVAPEPAPPVDATGCTVYEGEQCFWMENQSGNSCWVPAEGRAPDFESCQEADSCDGGGHRSGGGCYKWSVGSAGERAPWRRRPRRAAAPQGR